MLESIILVYRLILPAYRRTFFLLVALSLAVAMLEMVGVASIMPLIAVMLNPNGSSNGQGLSNFAQLLGSGGKMPPVYVVG